jgi:hypothetical protein
LEKTATRGGNVGERNDVVRETAMVEDSSFGLVKGTGFRGKVHEVEIMLALTSGDVELVHVERGLD